MPPTSVFAEPSSPIVPAGNVWLWLLVPLVVVLVIFALGVLTGWAMRRPSQRQTA
jgi:hypothetical protein